MRNSNKIYLLGFMGSGKSTVGALLAKKLDCNFIDLDLFIESKYKKTINEIFTDSGEDYFRSIETESLSEVSKLNERCVVSTGGGAVLSDTNWELMRESGTTFYLEAELGTIWDRIKNDKNRPLLNVDDPLKAAEKLLKARNLLYEKSENSVKTDDKAADQVAEEIVKIIKNKS